MNGPGSSVDDGNVKEDFRIPDHWHRLNVSVFIFVLLVRLVAIEVVASPPKKFASKYGAR